MASLDSTLPKNNCEHTKEQSLIVITMRCKPRTA